MVSDEKSPEQDSQNIGDISVETGDPIAVVRAQASPPKSWTMPEATPSLKTRSTSRSFTSAKDYDRLHWDRKASGLDPPPEASEETPQKPKKVVNFYIGEDNDIAAPSAPQQSEAGYHVDHLKFNILTDEE